MRRFKFTRSRKGLGKDEKLLLSARVTQSGEIFGSFEPASQRSDRVTQLSPGTAADLPKPLPATYCKYSIAALWLFAHMTMDHKEHSPLDEGCWAHKARLLEIGVYVHGVRSSKKRKMLSQARATYVYHEPARYPLSSLLPSALFLL